MAVQYSLIAYSAHSSDILCRIAPVHGSAVRYEDEKGHSQKYLHKSYIIIVFNYIPNIWIKEMWDFTDL